LILCSLLLLIGCSQNENPKEYKGEYGTYEILDTQIIEDSEMLREEYTQLQWEIKYKNTTNEPRVPHEVIELDMIIERETDIVLNEIPFTTRIYTEGKNQLTKEKKELYDNRRLSVKPGATVQFIALATPIEGENIDSIFMRNRNKQGQNGDKFEKEIRVDNY
jgi:hypothetical protein